MKKQTKGWLESANNDLLLIKEIEDNEDLTRMVAFHAQQAIEKSYKAILEENNEIVPRIHSLLALNKLIKKYLEIDVDQNLLKQIDELYIDARYPSDLGLLPEGKPSKELAGRMHLLAKSIYDTIKKKWA